ncbi:MAG: hypothetical protein ACO1SV_21830 [Fimbriimonas sp.]
MPNRPDISTETRGSVSLKEAMRYAGIGHRRATKLIEAKKWRAYPCGRELRVIVASIREWMEAEAAEYSESLGRAA